jgi:signal transduction histidine kinase
MATRESIIEQRVQPKYKYAGALSYAFPFFIAVGILWIFIKADIDRQYEQTIREANGRLAAYANAGEGELYSKFSDINRVLQAAINERELGNAQDLERLISLELKGLQERYPKTNPKLYFQNEFTRSAGSRELLVSKVRSERPEGVDRLVFTRIFQLNSLGAVQRVSLELEPTFLQSRIDRANGEAGLLLAVTTTTGQLLWGHVGQVGKTMISRPLVLDEDAKRLSSATSSLAKDQRVVRLRLASDNVDRLYVWRTLEQSPLIFFVGQSYDDVMRQYRTARDRYLLFGLAISLLLTASLYWFFAFRHSVEQAEIRQKVSYELLKEQEHELAESRESLRQLTAREFDLKEEERKRIALEIHDELGQRLTALRLELALAEKAATGAEAKPSPAGLKKLKSQVDKIIEIVRDITFRLRPAALEVGLVEATMGLLQGFRRATKVAVEFDNQLPEDFFMPEAKTVVVFRILQESLTNVAKHAKAKHLRLLFSCENNTFVMRIADDGRGFDLNAMKDRASTGLSGMRERALSIGGELSVSSIKAIGTTVQVVISNYAVVSEGD